MEHSIDKQRRKTSLSIVLEDGRMECCDGEMRKKDERHEEATMTMRVVQHKRRRQGGLHQQTTAISRSRPRCTPRSTLVAALVLLFLALISPPSSHAQQRQQRRRRANNQKSGQQEQLEFIKAMREIEDEKNLQEGRRKLKQRLLKKAQFIPAAAAAATGDSNSQKPQPLQQSQPRQSTQPTQEFQQPNEDEDQVQQEQRELGNNNNNNNNNNYQYYQDQNYIDGDNNGNNNNANENNNNNDYADVDLSGYALKYTGCQNIHTWDDNLVGSGYASPLAMNRFVMFRVCEAESCSAYNKWGCNYEFGQYMIPMEDYLSIMADYHLEQYGRYCITCYNCMSMDYYTQEEDEDEEADDAGDDAAAVADDAYVADDAAAAGDDQVEEVYDDAYVNTNYSFGDDYWAGYRRYWYEPSYWNDDGGGNNNRRLDQNNYYQNQGGGAMNYYYGGNYYTDDANAGDDQKWDDYYNVDQDEDHPWYADDDGKCIFENVCSNFRYACRDYNPNSTFYEDYYACSAFAVGNNVGYIGPHCRSDGRTIGIGIYKDATCSVYLGDEEDIQQFTGYEFDSSELQFYYDKLCISCSAIEGFSLVTDDALKATRQITYPLCSMLYENSGKCNRYFDLQDYNYEYSNQYSNEDEVCEYIESLVENNYDETGEIYMRNREFDVGNWAHPGEYTKIVTSASPFQIFFLIVSIFTFLGLSMYSCYLTKKLYYRMPWRPPTSVNSPYAWSASVAGGSLAAVSEAGRVSRVNSGVVAARSRSGEGTSLYGESGRGSALSATSPAPPFEFPTSLASTKPHTTTNAHSGTFA